VTYVTVSCSAWFCFAFSFAIAIAVHVCARGWNALKEELKELREIRETLELIARDFRIGRR